MALFDVLNDLRIGTILEVSGTTIRGELGPDLKELTRSHRGTVYSVGQIGSIIKIHFGRRIILAAVTMLRMQSEIMAEQGVPVRSPYADSRILEADLFGEGIWDAVEKKFFFERGLRTYPLPQQALYLTTYDELERVYHSAEISNSSAEHDSFINIGTYAGSVSALCRANADKLFGHHCAILGSTGSGKSGVVAALVHAVLEKTGLENSLRPRIVMIDPHGEYGRCFGHRTLNFRAYDLLGETTDEKSLIKLPYWLMSGSEFRSLVIGKNEFEATRENNIVYQALAHARMVELGMVEPAKDWIGQQEASGDPLKPIPRNGYTEDDIASFDRDLPTPFRLDEFVKHIMDHQGVRVKDKKWQKMSPTDFAPYQSILNKLSLLRSDPRIGFLMEDVSLEPPSLSDVIAQLVGYTPGDTRDVRVIDTSGLPNEVAGPLAALIARLLFHYKSWQSRGEREKDPVLLICEEAHRYVPSRGEAEYSDAQLAIQRIAKEGRKYGIGIILVSQRPSDVDSTVMSQCNSWIILRLTNLSDQEHVRRYLPDHLSGMVKLLPSLSRREALFVGEAAALPARIKIRELKNGQIPDSNDISFVQAWGMQSDDNEHIRTVTDRWQRKPA